MKPPDILIDLIEGSLQFLNTFKNQFSTKHYNMFEDAR